jgi:hypothetical protein
MLSALQLFLRIGGSEVLGVDALLQVMNWIVLSWRRMLSALQLFLRIGGSEVLGVDALLQVMN